MVVLDSTFIIDFLKNKRNALEKTKRFSEKVSTTRINVFEVLVGIQLKKPEEKEKALVIFSDFLQMLTVLELDAINTELAAKIYADLHRGGKTVAYKDVLIAAIAMAKGEETIITENARDFEKIKGIKAEKY